MGLVPWPFYVFCRGLPNLPQNHPETPYAAHQFFFLPAGDLQENFFTLLGPLLLFEKPLA